MHMMHISKTHDALHPFISYLPAPTAEQENFLVRSHIVDCYTCCPSATGMDELAAASLAAGCFLCLGAGLGAGLATVGASTSVVPSDR